ncbi:MAG: YegP family protein, partial [Planctomycetota bacterium]
EALLAVPAWSVSVSGREGGDGVPPVPRKVPEGVYKMAGKFEVYSDKRGEFRWRLKASNGRQIASSGEGYKDKKDCLKGIASLQKNAPGAKIIEEAPAAPVKKKAAKKAAVKKTVKKKAAKKKA